MTVIARPNLDGAAVRRAAIRRAAVRATLAPSIYNTQPWRFVISADSLEVHADWTRRLRVLDPRGRQLLLSCGAAVFTARVALAAAGFAVVVERLPDPARPDLLARLTIAAPAHPSVRAPNPGASRIADLEPTIGRRHTNRHRFTDEAVPDDLRRRLSAYAAAEGAQLFDVTACAHRTATVRLSRAAAEVERLDPAYRAELRAWTSEDPTRRDGVGAATIWPSDARSSDGVPLRDFHPLGHGELDVSPWSRRGECLMLLGTEADAPLDWLRAGEALDRVLLEIARSGYTASPLTQVIEVAATNVALRQELGLSMTPHVLLRIGRAPATPASRRRRLADVLSESM